MIIGVDTRPIYNKPAGIGVYVENLVVNLKKADKKLEIIEFGPKPRGVWWHPVVYFRLLASKRVDYYLSTHSYLMPCLPFVKSILVVHDLSAYLVPGDYPKKIMIETKLLLRLALSRSKHIIVPSKATKTDLVRLFKIDSGKITVVYHGKPPCRKQTDLKAQVFPTPFFLFLGTIQPRKNLAILLRAFAKLKKEFRQKNLKLVIAGQKGWKFQEVFKIADALNLKKEIIFLGYVSNRQKMILLKRSIALVLPSKYEGFGLPLVEAFACGCPVICSDTPALKEIGDQAPLYFNPDDQIRLEDTMRKISTWYFQQSPLYQKLVEQSLERSRRFSWQQSAKETLGIINSLGR